MKVLITGATGLVGEELVSQCHAKGYSVNYLTTSKNKIVSEDKYQGFYWNPSKNEIDSDCFHGVTVIINLAGASISKRWTAEHKKQVLHSRTNSLNTLYRVLEENENHAITSIISASAIGIYPDSLSNLYTEDEKAIDDSFLGDVVSVWEEKVDQFKNLGLQVSKIRIGLVLSSNGGALPEIAKPVKYYVGAAFGSGEQWQSWIHISDLARIFLFVAENKLEGTYNGVAPNPVTNNKLVKEVAKVLGKPIILPNIPNFVMKALLGEMANILFASQRVSSKKIEEEGFIFDYQNICAALKDIYENSNVENSIESKIKKEFVS
jgi:hypothetical protein